MCSCLKISIAIWKQPQKNISGIQQKLAKRETVQFAYMLMGIQVKRY